ncbi:MAG: site-2 protease family protein [Bauldia sp.]|nr:site-2 protease family protein [Bauldia sp.]
MGLFNLTPELLVANLIAVLIGMTVHEYAHCVVADLMGDPTPRSQGRLTLNPFVHIHWLGFIMFALIGFGMLGSAPVSPRRMQRPKLGAFLAISAGPIANLFVAAVFALLLQALLPSFMSGTAPAFLFTVLQTVIQINIVLFLFNLLPFYPLDGWRIAETLLPLKAANWWSNNWQPSYFLFLGLILLSILPPSSGIPNPLRILIMEPTIWLMYRMMGLV